MSSFLSILTYFLLTLTTIFSQPNNIQDSISCGQELSFTDGRAYSYDITTSPTRTVLFTTCNSGISQNTRLWHWYYNGSWQSDLCHNGGANSIGDCTYCPENAARWTLVLSTGSYYIEVEHVGSGGIKLTMDCNTLQPTTETPSNAPSTTTPTTSLPTTDTLTTSAPTTDTPTTTSPSSIPTTTSPITSIPTTNTPTTLSPTSTAPTTLSPTTTSTTKVPTTILTIPASSTTVLTIGLTSIATTHISIASTNVSELAVTEQRFADKEDDIITTMIIVVGVLGVLIVVMLIWLVVYMRKEKKNTSTNSDENINKIELNMITNTDDALDNNNVQKDEDEIINEDIYINQQDSEEMYNEIKTKNNNDTIGKQTAVSQLDTVNHAIDTDIGNV